MVRKNINFSGRYTILKFKKLD